MAARNNPQTADIFKNETVQKGEAYLFRVDLEQLVRLGMENNTAKKLRLNKEKTAVMVPEETASAEAPVFPPELKGKLPLNVYYGINKDNLFYISLNRDGLSWKVKSWPRTRSISRPLVS